MDAKRVKAEGPGGTRTSSHKNVVPTAPVKRTAPRPQTKAQTKSESKSESKSGTKSEPVTKKEKPSAEKGCSSSRVGGSKENSGKAKLGGKEASGKRKDKSDKKEKTKDERSKEAKKVKKAKKAKKSKKSKKAKKKGDKSGKKKSDKNDALGVAIDRAITAAATDGKVKAKPAKRTPPAALLPVHRLAPSTPSLHNLPKKPTPEKKIAEKSILGKRPIEKVVPGNAVLSMANEDSLAEAKFKAEAKARPKPMPRSVGTATATAPHPTNVLNRSPEPPDTRNPSAPEEGKGTDLRDAKYLPFNPPLALPLGPSSTGPSGSSSALPSGPPMADGSISFSSMLTPNATKAMALERKKRPGTSASAQRNRRNRLTEEVKNALRERIEKKVPVSAELAAVCGGKTELSRSEAVADVWKYIRLKGLMDSRDGRIIHCDQTLRSLFQLDLTGGEKGDGDGRLSGNKGGRKLARAKLTVHILKVPTLLKPHFLASQKSTPDGDDGHIVASTIARCVDPTLPEPPLNSHPNTHSIDTHSLDTHSIDRRSPRGGGTHTFMPVVSTLMPVASTASIVFPSSHFQDTVVPPPSPTSFPSVNDAQSNSSFNPAIAHPPSPTHSGPRREPAAPVASKKAPATNTAFPVQAYRPGGPVQAPGPSRSKRSRTVVRTSSCEITTAFSLSPVASVTILEGPEVEGEKGDGKLGEQRFPPASSARDQAFQPHNGPVRAKPQVSRASEYPRLQNPPHSRVSSIEGVEAQHTAAAERYRERQRERQLERELDRERERERKWLVERQREREREREKMWEREQKDRQRPTGNEWWLQLSHKRNLGSPERPRKQWTKGSHTHEGDAPHSLSASGPPHSPLDNTGDARPSAQSSRGHFQCSSSRTASERPSSEASEGPSSVASISPQPPPLPPLIQHPPPPLIQHPPPPRSSAEPPLANAHSWDMLLRGAEAPSSIDISRAPRDEYDRPSGLVWTSSAAALPAPAGHSVSADPSASQMPSIQVCALQLDRPLLLEDKLRSSSQEEGHNFRRCSRASTQPEASELEPNSNLQAGYVLSEIDREIKSELNP